MEELKPLKLGNVWGVVSDVQQKKSERGTGKPYLFLTINIDNPLLGQFKTFGRIWGEKRITDFLELHKKNKTKIFRLTGFFSQYNDSESGTRYSNYTFTRFQISSPEQEKKAAFVIIGKVLEKLDDGKNQIVTVQVYTPKTEHYEATIENYELYLHPDTNYMGYNSFAAFEEITVDDPVQTSGYLRAKEPEDEFGMMTNAIKPYISSLSKIQIKTEEEPF
jgi:hypothetical protein